MTGVRELLDLAAEPESGTPVAPVDAILAAGRARLRRRRAVTTLGTGAVAVAVAVAGVVAVQPGAGPAGLGPGQGGGPGDTVCGDVRFDRSALPGKPVRDGSAAKTSEQAADTLRLYGWPRIAVYDAARLTLVTAGEDDGVLVVALPGGQTRFAPVHRQRDGSWLAGAPCTPRPAG